MSKALEDYWAGSASASVMAGYKAGRVKTIYAGDGDRQKTLLSLKAKSPMRSQADQVGVDGLELFDTARQPKLF